MSLPLFDRVVRPFLDKVGHRLNRNAGAGSTDALQEKLNLAGRPWGLSASGFLALRLLSMLLFTSIGMALALFASLTMPLLVVVPDGGLILGYLGPQIVVARRIKKRQKEILLSLPSALDLLTISVEAGLGFAGSLQLVADRFQGPLGQELRLTLHEQSMGLSTGQALENFRARCDTPSVRAFARAVSQGETLGVSIGTMMRNLASETRKRRRQLARASGTQNRADAVRARTARPKAAPARTGRSSPTHLAATRTSQISMGCSMWP